MFEAVIWLLGLGETNSWNGKEGMEYSSRKKSMDLLLEVDDDDKEEEVYIDDFSSEALFMYPLKLNCFVLIISIDLVRQQLLTQL